MMNRFQTLLSSDAVNGFNLLRPHTKAIQRMADAADVNGDGVIQWAEFYYAAKVGGAAT